MDTTDFAAILRQVKPYTGHLALHVLGEPLLHPNLDQILALCVSHGLRVNLTTNATLLSQRQELLLNSPALRQLNISLHSAITAGASPAHSDYLSNILAFIRQATASTPLFICLRLWDITFSSDPASSPSRQSILRRLESNFSLPARLGDQLTPGQGITLAPRVFLSQNPRFTWPHAEAPDLGPTGTCRGLRDHVAILVDGTVVPCCLDAEADIRLGNIHTQPLSEILASPRATALYEGLLQQRLVEPLCRRCTFRR